MNCFRKLNFSHFLTLSHTKMLQFFAGTIIVWYFVSFVGFASDFLARSGIHSLHNTATSLAPLKIMCFSYPTITSARETRAQSYMEWIKWKINNTEYVHDFQAARIAETTTSKQTSDAKCADRWLEADQLSRNFFLQASKIQRTIKF